ncbi:exonuclease SbcCD C subunit [Clostridium sp. CAG:411]|nr:exonuclease SbcCD C subunit [Clostridium sp. CAG:411]
MEETLQKADAAYEGKEKELQALQEQAKDLQVISLEEKQLAQRKQDIDTLLVLEEKLKVLAKKEEKERTILRQAQRKQQEIEEEYNRIYDVFMHNQAAFLRQQLQEGMPCPVCGSVHHEPKMWTKEQNNEENVDKEYLKKMEAEKKKASEERERANVGYERTKQEWKMKEEEWKRSKERLFGEKEVSLLEEQKQVKQQLEQCEKAKKKAEKDSIQIKQLEKWVENYQTKRGSHEKKMKDTAEQLTKQQVSLATLTAKYTAVSERLPFAEKNEAQERLHLLMVQYDKLVTAKKESQSHYEHEKAEMDKRQGQLQQLEKHAENLKKELESAIKVYEEQLLKAGFADTKQYQDAYLAQKEIEKLRQEVSSFQEKQIRLTERIRHLTEQTKGKEPLDITEYKEKKEQLQEEKNQVERQGNEIYHLVTTNEEAKKMGKALYKERAGLWETGNVLQKLYNTVNGKLAGKHLTFQTYMQREFFKEIIERANMRLVKMSGQQFLLQCRNIEDLGAQGEVGLDLDIYSLMTDQVRDVKTLSGGESFLASLSMALGMADMIQNSNGAVHLDTMFIDEGFGSLSDETRNEAIGILNELSEGKRLVGIISHVSELKSQVGTKLIIEKSSRGSHHKWELDSGIV